MSNKKSLSSTAARVAAILAINILRVPEKMRVEGATVHEMPQYMREKKSLSCTAAATVSIYAPQFESFYTVPRSWTTLTQD